MRKPAARTTILSALLMLGLSLVTWPGVAAADSEIKIAGFVDVPPTGPGGTLTLPLAPGAPPVTILVQLGTPPQKISIQVTSSTAIESGLPVTLTDNDRVKIDAVIAGSVIQATKLELDPFPELEVTGAARGLPDAGVTLPLAAGTTVTFTVSLVPGVDVSVVLTENTKAEEGPLTLTNGTIVQIEAVLQNNQLVVTEVSATGAD